MKRLFAVAVVFASLGLILGLYMRGGSQTAIAAAGAGGGGGAQCASQNGDVNASGAVDLSDAVTILNFLFLGNPTSLVPICDPPELTARIQELEAQLAGSESALATCSSESSALTARIQDLETQLAVRQTELAEAETALAICRSELSACNAKPSGLPDTGQTQCYDCSGQLTQCLDCSGRPRPCEGFMEAFLTLQDSFQRTGCPNDASRFVDHGDGTVTDNCTRLMWQKNTADTNGDGSVNKIGRAHV